MISNLEPSQTSDAGSLNFSIPPEEATAGLREGVPAEVLSETRTLLGILGEIHRARKVRPECARQARLCAFKWSAETLAAKYYLFVRGNEKFEAGHWRLALNKAKAPSARTNTIVLKFAFYEFWRSLGEQNQRVWSAAHTELVQIWKTGCGFPRANHKPRQFTKIPGYTAWPEADAMTGIPEGWTLSNLMRHTSDPYDQAAARVGRSKASEHRLPVLTTRVNLKVGQYYEFDDHEFNQKVMFQKKPMRPLGFGVVDVFSGCCFAQGFKPTLWDFEEEVRKKLTEKEFMWFVIAVLTSTGYRRDALGTTLIVERGTAAIRAEFRERLERVFGGRVKVEVGGRFGKAAHAGQFNGRSHGNFKTKALVEGLWSIVDNQMAALPAQVGKDRDHAPEQLYGLEQYTAQIIKKAEGLSPERQALIQFPCPTFHLWREWAMDAFRRINLNPEHKLEGWEKLGFVQPMWRLPGGGAVSEQWLPWSAFEQLEETQKPVVRSLLDRDASLVTTRRLSRMEVFAARRRELTPAPLELLPELVGVENAINGGAGKEVKKGLFSFDDGEIDSDPMHFYARDVGSRAGQFLPNGEKYIPFVNPYDPRALVACELTTSGKLRVVAVCPRYELADKADEKAIQIRMGEQSAYEASARQRLNLRHADAAGQKEEMERHNERVFSGAPITAQERVNARIAAAKEQPTANPSKDNAFDCTKDLLARKDEAVTNDDWK
jgi:hypothetical protein